MRKSTAAATSASGPLLAVLLVAAFALPAWVGAEPIRVPMTLETQVAVAPGPLAAGFPIDYVAVWWEQGDGGDHADHDAPAVRFLTGGVWGEWVAFVEDGADAPGTWSSNLVPGGDADAFEIRGVPHDAVRPRAVALNTTDGPLVTVGYRPAAADAFSHCLSRRDWGADESLRTSKRSYAPVQVMTVHHTVTPNEDRDPAATVRAIYHYHTRSLGWDDIGYHYLVDERGRLYEGRWSGTDSRSCRSAGGDGADFAHDRAGRLVTGAHTGGYNDGNVGIALVGDFRRADPTPAAVSALEDGLAELAARHRLDPLGTVDYDNGTRRRRVHTIAGHRDFKPTACPGDRLYEDLPAIRTNAAAKRPPPPADAVPGTDLPPPLGSVEVPALPDGIPPLPDEVPALPDEVPALPGGPAIRPARR